MGEDRRLGGVCKAASFRANWLVQQGPATRPPGLFRRRTDGRPRLLTLRASRASGNRGEFMTCTDVTLLLNAIAQLIWAVAQLIAALRRGP